MNIFDQLADAKIIVVDPDAQLFLAWHGGHGVHAYTADGTEVAYWNVGDFARTNADPRTVRRSMRDRIQRQDYADFS